MTLRTKLNVFVTFFFLVSSAFAGGSIVIFSHLNGNLEALRSAVGEHTLYEDLKSSIANLSKAAKSWAITGDQTFKKQYHDALNDIYRDFGNLQGAVKDAAAIEALRMEFETFRDIAHTVILIEKPVGNMDAIFALRRLEAREGELQERLDSVYRKSLKEVADVGREGEIIKRELAYYLTLLLIISFLAFLFLAFFIKRMIEAPFRDMLTATDKIISGDLNYRIFSKRKDEFGIIANRFDTMVGELQSISKENEDLYLSTRRQLQKLTAMYELAKAITSTLNLDELLAEMTEEATRLFHAKGSVIRLLEDSKLVVKASFGVPREIEGMMSLSLNEGLPGKVARDGKAILVEDLSAMSDEWKIPHLDAKSAMNVPLKVGSTVIGTFALYDKMLPEGNIIAFSGDDLSTAEGFATLSAIAIEKAKMFEAELKKEQQAIDAKRKMDALFESVQGGIISIVKDYTITSVNKFVERWIGMPADEMVGKNCMEIFHGRKGVCPHCVAQVTVETGEINTITQVSGLNYAELTSYPIKDEGGNVTECVVYIQDITDKVLYQEEMLALYKEGTQTKEYLESLIENSADAIVTSDLNGIITSWNQGAERIYGFTEMEAVGKVFPFVPDFLKEIEKGYTERVRNGQVLKDVEAVRQRADGTIMEVSLTLSPIKDASGEIIGISGISRDISEKKRVEKELIRKNQELSRLFFISSAMRSTLDLDRLLRMILTAVTMGEGLGFNRAVLFLVDEEKNVLKGTMGVGPASHEEAGTIWNSLYNEQRTLGDVMQEIETGPLRKDSFLDRLCLGIEIPLESDCSLAYSVREKKPVNVTDARGESFSNPLLIQQLGTEAYATVPLISREKVVIGVIWVDNLYNKRPITDEDMQFLNAFSNQVAAAIESAKLFEKVSFAEAELENIFRSISDMVYFTDMNYTIKSINKAVADRFGVPEKEIVGKKCYEIFHGMHEPWRECPHQKTVMAHKASVEELEDPYLGGTFLSSTSPIFDTTGNFMGTVHIVRDITEIKQIQERLATAERMAALGEVAAKVAHEIRNPLVSVGGFAQRLEKKLDGNLKEYSTIIINEVRRLEAILKDILGFVREVRLAKTRVNINDIISDVFSLVESELHDRGIHLKTSLGAVETTLLDPDRVKEAFLNIMNNAIQAVGAQGEITVKTYHWNGYAVAEVNDTGSGIEEKDLPFIFDPFYTTKPTGTGLGLAITRRIIEEHKGRIEVKSRMGEGTTIKVFLPKGKEES
ncbi:MAG: PAS domain S-box protein [Thermodesulfovibrionales bacterium]|jgi:PAS domain S-box-containing protein